MSVTRSMRKVQKVVSILADPHPEYVSLVDFPANQTPFKSVKFDPARAEDHAAALAKKAASEVIDIESITFSKKIFKTKEAVEGYLSENGYENYVIHELDASFHVPGHAADDFDGATKAIEVKKGISMSVGRLRPARKSAPTPAAEPEIAVKSLWTVADFASILQSLAYLCSDVTYEAAYEGDDSPIPDKIKAWLASGAEIFKEMAAEEVAELIAAVQVLKAAKAAQKKESEAVTETATKGKTASGQATPLDKTTTPVAQPGTTPTAVKPAATAQVEGKPNGDDAAQEPAATTETPAEGTETPAGDTPAATTEEPAASTEEPAAETDTAAKAATAPIFDMAAFGQVLGETLGKALEPVNKQLTALAEASTKSNERIESLEAGVRQTRKSADQEDAGAPSTRQDTEDSKKSEDFRRRQSNNLLGI